MHFADLTDYEYGDPNLEVFSDRASGFYSLAFRPNYLRLNVGWLENGQPYTTGSAPSGFVEKLTAIADIQRVNCFLGQHECDLCNGPWERSGQQPRGTSELRIPGAAGLAYAAPQLITHYMAAHDYLPPASFVEAVQAINLDEWERLRWRIGGHVLAVAYPWIPSDAALHDPDDPATWEAIP
ncbi:hypothetical protein GCM10027589_47280 [Actinocorallia lasiicapitis]